MKFRIACVIAILATGALAQTAPPSPSVAVPDLPFGAPYNVGAMAAQERIDNAQVSLRDYLSSRIDQIAADLNSRIEQQQNILNERDHQYAQRFDAQQEALSAALLAQKEAVANALSAAKEAVNKAEEANSKRFDSVNEFRSQLNDQVTTFVSKETAEARFTSLEEKTASNTDRLNGLQASSAGANSTWAYVAAVVMFIIAVGAFAMRFRSAQI